MLLLTVSDCAGRVGHFGGSFGFLKNGFGRMSLRDFVSTFVIGIASLAVAVRLEAAILVKEQFSYSDGLLIGNSPSPGPGAIWVAHTDEGNTPIYVKNGAAVLSQGKGSGGREDANIGFPVQPTTATTYARFDFVLPSGQLVDPDEHGLVFAHIKSNRSTNHFRANMGLMVAAGEGDFGLAINANGLKLDEGTAWPVDLLFDTTYRVVTNWNSVTGEAKLWLNPVNESSPFITHTGHSTLQPMESYALRQSSDYSGTQIIDNIVVATSFVEALTGIDNSVLAGDYNHDGIVDAADYTVWRNNLGNVGAPGIAGDGDDGTLTGTPDGMVDQKDYEFWRSRYGMSFGTGSITIVVPEPATHLAFGIMAVMATAAGLTQRGARRANTLKPDSNLDWETVNVKAISPRHPCRV